MGWPNDPRPAKSLTTLRDQVNALSPNRDKSSDGMLASGPHHVVNPNSDHEPHVMDDAVGVVTAIDISHDPAHGIDSEALAEALRAAQDSRIKYIISNRKIASGAGEAPGPAWQWRPYNGSNPHNHHCHISVKAAKAAYDSTVPWTINMVPVAAGAAAAAAVVKPPAGAVGPLLHKGAAGPDVIRLQTLLNAKGATLTIDGQFGDATMAALTSFQAAKGLVADGVCGRQSWAALNP